MNRAGSLPANLELRMFVVTVRKTGAHKNDSVSCPLVIHRSKRMARAKLREERIK
jgi:hypothetical protein